MAKEKVLTEEEKKVEFFSQSAGKILEEIKKDIVGQEDVVEDTVIALVAGGNVLLEGVPGVGKTRLVRSLGRTFSLPFSRIQFTPDLMPGDVTGTNIIEKDDSGKTTLRFQPGPIFSQILLADEINRATPKTQSALLEAMQEHTVTVGGTSRKLDEPFFVLATQNPIEQDGTYPLPEAQVDRFMFKLLMGFPNPDELKEIVNMTQITMDETAEAVADAETLLEMREVAKGIPVIDEIMDYVMYLVSATHPTTALAPEFVKKYVRLGASPRACQALITTAKVRALMKGRYNVSFGDINELAYPVLRHRIKLSFQALTEKLTPDDVIGMLIKEVSRKKSIPERIASTFQKK